MASRHRTLPACRVACYHAAASGGDMRQRPTLARRMVVPLGLPAALLGAGVLLGVAMAGSAGPTAAEPAPGLLFDRIFIIVLENTDFDRAMRAPFLHHLTTRGAL